MSMAAAAAGLATTLIGAGNTTQIGVNSSLAKQIGHFLPASAVSFLGGTVLLTIVNGVLYLRARGSGELQEGRWDGFSLVELCGGFIGTCTLIASTALSPFLGFTVGATISSAAQCVSSLLVDRIGLLGMPRRSLSWQRIFGAALVVIGCVGSSRSVMAAPTVAGASAVSSTRLVGLALLYFVVRSGQPLQSALNRRLADRLPLRSMAACVSFAAGSIGVCSCCAVLFFQRPKAWRAVVDGFTRRSASVSSGVASQPMRWWMPLGGAFGATQVTSTIFLVPQLSATVYFNCMTVGQLLCSMVQDTMGAFGNTKRPITACRLLSVGLTYIGTVLTQEPSGLRRRKHPVHDDDIDGSVQKPIAT
jgi:transporter family-2 protein